MGSSGFALGFWLHQLAPFPPPRISCRAGLAVRPAFSALLSVSRSAELEPGVGKDKIGASRSPSHAHAVLSPDYVFSAAAAAIRSPGRCNPQRRQRTLRRVAHRYPARSSCTRRIRLRIDGALHVFLKPPPHLRDAFITRIKVLARMDIAERRVPQDGRLRLPLANGNPEDYRVNSLPEIGRAH